MKKIKLGISTCLTGAQVRYDGQGRRDSFLMDTLAKFVDYTHVCPEVECGLPTPRDAMRLVGDVDNPRLITIKTKQDMTAQMNSWIKPTLQELAKKDLCGFIFKSKSPSSGLYRVKVYKKDNAAPVKQGTGLFAAAFTARFPDIPVEEAGRLNDQLLRECFINKVSAYSVFRDLQKKPQLKIKDLMDFHAAFKYSIMAHNPASVAKLGKMLAVKSADVKQLAALYLSGLMEALSVRATRRKNTNVLDHISGYFKKDLTPVEKDELRRIITGYHGELYPLLAPLVLLRHYAVIYDKQYLLRQYYLNPDPLQLNCRF